MSFFFGFRKAAASINRHTVTYSEHEQHRVTVYCNSFHTCTLKHTHFILPYSGATQTLLLSGWVAHLSCFLHVVSLNNTKSVSVNHMHLNTIQKSVMFQFSPTHCFHNQFSKFMHIQQNELNAYTVSTPFNGSCVQEKQVLVVCLLANMQKMCYPPFFFIVVQRISILQLTFKKMIWRNLFMEVPSRACQKWRSE